jgi:hypothetical protein
MFHKFSTFIGVFQIECKKPWNHQGFFIIDCAHNKYLLLLVIFNQERNMAKVKDQEHSID